MRKAQTAYGDVDVSALSATDVANLALQRTEVMFNTGIPRIGAPSYLFWARFNSKLPLMLEARLRRQKIISGALAVITAEVAQIVARLPSEPVARLCDIGCGYAFHDVFLGRVVDLTQIHLIDIEHTDQRHHDFNRCGAGYSNLERAAALLASNAQPGKQPPISTLNPQRQEMDFSHCFDLIISLLSCGFHYPVDIYLEFFERCLAPGGQIILDLRCDQDHASLFSSFRVAHKIIGDKKTERVFLVRK